MKNCVAKAVAAHSLASNSLAFKAVPLSLFRAIVAFLILFLLPSASAAEYYIQLHEVNLSLYAPPPSTICLDSETEIVADCIATPFVTDEDGQQLPLGEDGTWYIAAVCTWDWDTSDANDEKANPTPLGSPPGEENKCHCLIGYDEPGVYTIRVTCKAELREVGTDAVLDRDGPLTSNSVNLTVVEADINAAGVDDAGEDTEGAHLRYNDDDDDGDGLIDYQDSQVSGEDDLLELTIQPVQPAGVLSSTDLVNVTWDGPGQVYEQSDKSGLVIWGQQFELSALPMTLYLEGAAPTDSLTVTLEYIRELDDGQPYSCTDTIAVTVTDVQIQALGVLDELEELEGASLLLNDDDDDGDGILDKGDTDGVAGEGDLLQVELQAVQPGTLPDSDKVTLTWVGEDQIDVFEDSTKSMPITSGIQYRLDQLPRYVYVEGDEPSGQERDVALRLAYFKNGVTDEDVVCITVVRPDLAVDGVSDEIEAQGQPPHETDPGAYVSLNDDDDNGNGQPDCEDAQDEYTLPDPDVEDDDLLEVQLSVTPFPVAGRVFLSWSGVRVWADRTKTALPDPPEWTVASMPAVVYVEGYDKEQTDCSVTLLYAPVTATDWQTADEIKLTIVGADIDGDLDQDGYVGYSDAENLAEATPPGLYVAVNDDDDDEDFIFDLDDAFNQDGLTGNPVDDRDDANTDEDDLITLTLTCAPGDLASGKIVLEAKPTASGSSGTGQARVWLDELKGAGNKLLDTSDSDPDNDQVGWTLGTDDCPTAADLPLMLFVEGIAVSDGSGDLTFELRYETAAGQIVHKDEIVLTVHSMRFVDKWGDADLGEVTTFSDPHPVVELAPIEPGAITLNNEVATFTISGTVTDAIADVVEGGTADIGEVFIEGHPDPIPVVNGGSAPASSLRPFPFSGTFGPVTVNLPLSNGDNVIAVNATNAIGNVGSDTAMISAEVEYLLEEVALEGGGTEVQIVGAEIDPATLDVQNNDATEVGLNNPIRVYIDDASILPGMESTVQAEFNGETFALKFDGGQLQLDRPFLAVGKPFVWEEQGGPPPPAGPPINNVINARAGQFRFGYRPRGRRTLTIGFMFGKKRAVRPKYASGTTVEHEIFLNVSDGEGLTTDCLDGPPKIYKDTSGQSEESGIVVDAYEIRDGGEPGKAVWMKLWLRDKQVHLSDPIKTVQVKIVGRPKPVVFKKNFRCVPLKIVICAVDAAGYEAVTSAVSGEDPSAANFGRAFGDGFTFLGLSALPTITHCIWPAILTGSPPKVTGILGNSYFPRDIAGANPIASRDKKTADYWDLRFAVLGKLHARTRPGVSSLYEQADAATSESLRWASINAFYAPPYGSAANRIRTTFPAWPLRRSDTYLNMILNPPAGIALAVTRATGMLGYSAEVATLQDKVSADEAIRVWRKRDTKIPDITTIYFPGPDTYAHWEGGPVGGTLVPSVRQHFENVTDLHFGRFLDHVEARGFLYATVFALVADHGMIGLHADDEHQLTIEDENGKEMELIFDEAFAPAEESLWRGTNIGQRLAVYSANDGMAHIYIRGADEEWSSPPLKADVEKVARTMYLDATASPRILGELEHGLGDPPAIFVRTNASGSSMDFANDYRWVSEVSTAGVLDYRPVGDYVAVRGLNTAWPQFEARLNDEMDDRGGQPGGSSRSGDIILIMNGAEGYATTPHWGAHPASHGGPTKAESEVPLMFDFFLQEGDNPFLANGLCTPPVGGDCYHSFQFTDMIVGVIDQVRD